MAKLEGLKPTNKSGKYFLNTHHWWKPLSDFLFDKCGILFRPGEIESWYSVEGHSVDGRTAQRISDRLESLLEDGTVKRYEIELMIAYPPVQCGYCKGKGVYPNGRECIACHGQGSSGQLNFSEENVRAFAKFCRNSGGFDVYSR
jgi:hypothetical protein